MTTKKFGGRITGLLALTFEATVALAVGDPVEVSGDYTVIKAVGTKPCIGHVAVANVKRDSVTAAYPVAKTPGDVTVEVRGFEVRTLTSGAAITAGTLVGWNASSALVPAGAGVATIGVALQPAAGAAVKIDVLVQ